MRAQLTDGELPTQLHAASQVLVLEESVYGEGSVESTRTLQEQANVMVLQSDIKGAAELARRVVEIREKKLDDDDIELAKAYTSASIFEGQTGCVRVAGRQ